MLDAVIFDLDGTLWDSSRAVCAIWNKVFDERYPELHYHMTYEVLTKQIGKTLDKIGESLFPELAPELRDTIMNDCIEQELVVLSQTGGELFEKVPETLQALSKKYRLFIVSNCQEGYIEAFMHAHGVERYFTDIEMAGRTGMGKGANIRLIMERNHVRSAVYLGDTDLDMAAAQEAGIPFIHAAYGFGAVPADQMAIREFSDLPGFLENR